MSGSGLGAAAGFDGLGLGDLDGDGDLDLAAAGASSNAVFFNNGAGVFASGPQWPTSGSRRALVFDRNGDGDLDLFFAGSSFGNAHALLDNSGTGAFSDVSAQVPTGASSGLAAVAGDVDGDGDIDLALSTRLLLNDGSGAFSVGANYPVSGAGSDSELADLDNDGDLDLVDSWRGVLLNDGAGNFQAGPNPFDDLLGKGGPIGVADLDADGDLDLLLGRGIPLFPPVVSSAADRLFLNTGSGGFVDATVLEPRLPPRSFPSEAAAIGDLDGDGDLDAFVANFDTTMASGVRRGSLYLNGGFGRFADGTDRLPFDNESLDAAGLADADSDGDLDIFVGGTDFSSVTAGVSYYTNSGSGDFAGSTPVSVASTMDYRTFALGDLDADGDTDVVIGVDGTQLPGGGGLVGVGDGSGNFAVSSSGLGQQDQQATAVELADFDGDGDLDAFFANRQGFGPFTAAPSTGRDELFLNNGLGLLALASGALPTPLGNEDTLRSAVGDIDSDGDSDLALGTLFGSTILANDGTGLFSNSQQLAQFGTGGMAFADVDLDGDADLLLASAVLRNDGSGSFTPDPTSVPVDFTGVNDFGLGDLDGDGDVDAFLAASGFAGTLSLIPGDRGPDRLWVNRARHLAWLNAPVVGRSLTVELCSEQPTVTSLWYARQLAPVALPPAGTVWLDITRGAQLELLGPSVGCIERSYAIPSLPALVGLELYLQSVRATVPTLELQLSNLEPFTALGG